MIPVVADALFEVLEENGWRAEYIRDAREPFFPFVRETSLYKTYRPVNFVKNMILNFCSLLLEKRMRRAGFKPMYLWGLVMSGNMDRQRVERLFPAMTDVPVILTLRRKCDGGKCTLSERQRRSLLLDALDGDFAYVDIEEDIKRTEVESKARA